MKKILFLLFLFSMHLFTYAQGDTARVFTFGGFNNERFFDIKEAPNNSYVAVGYTASYGNGNMDVYMVKLDPSCNHIWSKTFGGFNIDLGYSVTLTYDNGFAIAGYTNSFGSGGYDAYLIRTDSLGNVMWTKTYGGSDWDFVYSIAETPDSGFIMCGETFSYGNGNADAYLIKTDMNGNLIWEKTYGGVNKDVAYNVILTKDNKYVFIGETSSFGYGNADVYLSKISAIGDSVWAKTFGDTLDDIGYSVVQTLDSGYAMAGYTKNFSATTDTVQGDKDIYTLKADKDGIFVWQQVFGHTVKDDEGKDVLELTSGELFFTGYTGNGAGESDVFGLVTTSGGWWTAGSASYGEYGNDIAFANLYTSAHKFLMAGFTNTSTWSNGLEDGMVIFLDTLTPAPIQVVRLYNDSTVGIKEIDFCTKSLLIYPNPMKDFARIYFPDDIKVSDIKLKLLDAVGRTIAIHENRILNRIDLLDVNIAPGIYFLNVYSKESVLIGTGKLIAE